MTTKKIPALSHARSDSAMRKARGMKPAPKAKKRGPGRPPLGDRKLLKITVRVPLETYERLAIVGGGAGSVAAVARRLIETGLERVKLNFKREGGAA